MLTPTWTGPFCWADWAVFTATIPPAWSPGVAFAGTRSSNGNVLWVWAGTCRMPIGSFTQDPTSRRGSFMSRRANEPSAGMLYASAG